VPSSPPSLLSPPLLRASGAIPSRTPPTPTPLRLHPPTNSGHYYKLLEMFHGQFQAPNPIFTFSSRHGYVNHHHTRPSLSLWKAEHLLLLSLQALFSFSAFLRSVSCRARNRRFACLRGCQVHGCSVRHAASRAQSHVHALRKMFLKATDRLGGTFVEHLRWRCSCALELCRSH
jgi:hypothetical protein